MVEPFVPVSGDFGDPPMIIPLAGRFDDITTDNAEPDDFEYAANTSDPDLATAEIVGTDLVITFGPGTGIAYINVQASNDQAIISTHLQVGVSQRAVTFGGDTGYRSLRFTDADGTVSVLELSGAGTATVRFAGVGLRDTAMATRVRVTGRERPRLSEVRISGSDTTTVLSISSSGGDGVTELNDVSVDGDFKRIEANRSRLLGSLSADGGGQLSLLSSDGASIYLGGRGEIVAGDVVDTDIYADEPVALMKFKSFTGTDVEADIVSAPGIVSLDVAGDCSTEIIVRGDGDIESIKIGGDFSGKITADQIVSLTVKRDLSNATIKATHPANEHATAVEANLDRNRSIGNLAVGGAILNSTLNTAGSVGSISARSLSGSRLYIGFTRQTVLPIALSLFRQRATLNSFKVRTAFQNSDLACAILGNVTIGRIGGDNDGVASGLSGTSLAYFSVRQSSGTRIVVKNVTSQPEFNNFVGSQDIGEMTVTIL